MAMGQDGEKERTGLNRNQRHSLFHFHALARPGILQCAFYNYPIPKGVP